MSIEMDKPITLLEKLDAAHNYIAQMRLAKVCRDDVHFHEAYDRASRLLFESCRMVEDAGVADYKAAVEGGKP